MKGQDTAGRPDPPRDPALERAYAAGAREEPPARLDAAILAAARREVGARPRRLDSILRAWRAPVALAAVLVLSVSVVLLLREEGADRLDQAPDIPASPAADTARPPAAAAPTARPNEAPAAARSKEAAPQVRDAPASGPQALEEDRRKVEPPSGLTETAPPAAEAPRPAPQPFAEPPATPGESRRAVPEAPAQTRSLAKEMEPGAAAGARERAATAEREVQAQRAAPPATAAPPGKATEAPARPQARLGAAQPDSANRAEQQPRDDVAGVGARPVWQGFERQPPDKWLERVAELRRSGRDEEAREMLVEFRRRFPQHPVPSGLDR